MFLSPQNALREDVKELFNYEVSRDPSDRINDYIDWMDNIKKDIFHIRGVLEHPLKRFLYYSWYNVDYKIKIIVIRSNNIRYYVVACINYIYI